MEEKKVRYFQASFKPIPIEGKETDIREGDGTLIRGYASTPTLDRFNDIVEPEAFRKSIQTTYYKNPIVLFQHRAERPIGKAVFMSIDQSGLYIEALIVDNEVEPKIKAGILRTFSIGYIPTKVEFRDEENRLLDPNIDDVWREGVKRIIKEVDLVENSVVSVPANPDALFNIAKSAKSFFQDIYGKNIEYKIWEETENEIRYRAKNPNDFQKGSFRRIILKKDKPRVFAIIGKLKGESKTTIQALRFPKEDDWTMEEAKKWVKDNFNKNISYYYSLIKNTMTKKDNLLAKKEDENAIEEVIEETPENTGNDESVNDIEKEGESPENAEEAPETQTDETSGEAEGNETNAEGEAEAANNDETESEKEEEGEKAEMETEKEETEEAAETEEGIETEEEKPEKGEDEEKGIIKEIMTERGAKMALKAIKALNEKIRLLEEILKETPTKKAMAYFESSLENPEGKKVGVDTSVDKPNTEEGEKSKKDKKGFKEAFQQAAYL